MKNNLFIKLWVIFMLTSSVVASAQSVEIDHNVPYIVILRGPPAAGKTSVSLILKEKLAPVARINIDTLRYMVTPRNFSSKLLRAIKLNAAQLSIGFAQENISSIIESTFADRHIVEEMCKIIRDSGFTPYVFTLVIDKDRLISRNLDRELFDMTDPERIQQVLADYDWDLGTKIYVKDHEIEEVAEDIYMHLAEYSKFTAL